MAEVAAAKDSRQLEKEALEAGSTALASWRMLGYAQCPALHVIRGTRLIAEASFARCLITDRHDLVMLVTTPLPIFPDSSTLLPSCQSRPVRGRDWGQF